MAYDFTCMRCLMQPNPQRKKVDWWSPGAGGGRNVPGALVWEDEEVTEMEEGDFSCTAL